MRNEGAAIDDDERERMVAGRYLRARKGERFVSIIAIFSLIPFNFFTSRVSNLEFELQTAATNLEVMLEAQGKTLREVEIQRSTPASATRSSI